ncbi:MAG TPA: type II toxin-antitoxin system VapC family toxin [Dehalococcoidia bacterium]|nr:type II toxin-antitoxin system VapC family toxin [Dehalococcoidia bacterium]
MRWVDTNIFLRFLTGTEPDKAARCQALFERMQRGEEQGRTAEAIVAEVIYVLASPRQYGLTRPEIRGRLLPVLLLRGLRLSVKYVCLRALELWESDPRLDFEDALIVAHMESEGDSELYSYDRDFDRVPAVTRVEP